MRLNLLMSLSDRLCESIRTVSWKHFILGTVLQVCHLTVEEDWCQERGKKNKNVELLRTQSQFLKAINWRWKLREQMQGSLCWHLPAINSRYLLSQGTIRQLIKLNLQRRIELYINIILEISYILFFLHLNCMLKDKKPGSNPLPSSNICSEHCGRLSTELHCLLSDNRWQHFTTGHFNRPAFPSGTTFVQKTKPNEENTFSFLDSVKKAQWKFSSHGWVIVIKQNKPSGNYAVVPCSCGANILKDTDDLQVKRLSL